MERARLKLRVIFLLAVLDLCLLGVVVYQNHDARTYEKLTQDQTLIYLERHGISARRETIPWKTSLEVPVKKLPERILPQTPLPEGGLGESYEVQTMRRPETLVADLVRGIGQRKVSCTELRKITEGYRYAAQGDRAVLTPTWVVETDGGTFYLDCSDGSLRRAL